METEKHTSEDLKLWADYAEADLLYYHSHDMRTKEKCALKNIADFNPDYFSVSWGKDSVVLAHLAYRYNPKSCLIHYTHKADAVFFNMVRDKFLENCPMPYFEYQAELENQVIDEFFDFHKIKFTTIAKKEIGLKYVTGIRMQESGIRKMTIRKNGIFSGNRCSPLAYWKQEDIFAYLIFYDLPIHPNYAMLGGGKFKRYDIRVGPMWMASQMGNKLWENEYYKNELNFLRKKRMV